MERSSDIRKNKLQITKMIYCHSQVPFNPPPLTCSKPSNQSVQTPSVQCQEETVGHIDNLLKDNGFDHNLALINYSAQF